MKFDAIIGNPPYQLEGGSGGNNDSPVYQFFVNSSIKLEPNYISLITPARWFAAGRENLLGEFRRNMLSNKKMNDIYVYTDSHDIFPNVEIKGGICYFLIDNNYNGKCNYNLVHDGLVESYKRDLDDFDILIRDPIAAQIVKKVSEKSINIDRIDTIVSNDTPFGISSNVRTSTKNCVDVSSNFSSEYNIKLYHIEKNTRKIEYVKLEDIKKHKDDVKFIKVFIPGAAGSGNDKYVLGRPELADENSVCSQSYLYIKFKSMEEASNFIKYYNTKFFRVLVSAIKISQSAPNRVYKFVPIQDFTKDSDIDWAVNKEEIDNQLFKKYELSVDEINYINNKIEYIG